MNAKTNAERTPVARPSGVRRSTAGSYAPTASTQPASAIAAAAVFTAVTPSSPVTAPYVITSRGAVYWMRMAVATVLSRMVM